MKLPSMRIVFTLACILVCAARPSFAARHDAGAFSAEVPDGWTMTREDELTRFAASDGSVELTVILKKYTKPEINEIVAEGVGQTPVKMLTDNTYIYEDASSGRGWGMIAGDGTFAEIGANAAYDGLGGFLAGLKAAAAEKGLATIFTAAESSKEAAEWLLFAVPPFAEQDNADVGEEGGSDAGDTEEKEKGTPYEHKTFTAVVPEGWTAAEQGESVVFASDAKDAFVIVRVFSLASDDGTAFTNWAKGQVKVLKGKNVNAGEGVVEFTTEKGASGMFTQFDKKSLFLLFGGERPQIGNLIKSIGLVD